MRSSVLRDPAFLRLWVGTTASGLATWSLPFLLGLAVLDRTLDGAGLGLALAARTVGFLAAVPVAGVLADRYSRRDVVGASSAAAAVASPLVAWGMGTSTALVVLAAAVVGAGQGACRPAFQALTAEVVAAEQRQTANAATTIAVRVSTLVGPSAAALAALVVDTRTLVACTGALWLVAALLPPRGAGRAERTEHVGFHREFAEGLGEARRHPWFVSGLGALTAVIATGYSATGVALPLVSRDRYDSEVVLAAATTAYTAGALVGAFLIARWRPAAPGRVALLGLAVYAVAPLALWLPVPAAVVVAAYAVTGVGIELFNVPWFTAVQREVEPRLLARVSSVDFLFSYGLAPLGLALIAPAMAGIGTGPVLAACAGVCLVAPLLALLAPGAARFATAR
ncbi:MFS transporter [Pseudonocardia sp. RS010]|uniref:MFS transporter n=1 Tax=Pseudonocardia sp. RS010 TaxID=3385979 RepID=UPI0039A1279C